MNCPKCGLQAAPKQKFCRSCGESLQIITRQLDNPMTVSRLESQAPIDGREETNRTNILMRLALIILFLGAAIGVVGKKLMGNEVVTVIGVLVALAGMFLSVYPYVFLHPRSKRSDSPSSESELQAPSELEKNLLQERTIEYVPGITERTTDLLTQKRQKPKSSHQL